MTTNSIEVRHPSNMVPRRALKVCLHILIGSIAQRDPVLFVDRGAVVWSAKSSVESQKSMVWLAISLSANNSASLLLINPFALVH